MAIDGERASVALADQQNVQAAEKAMQESMNSSARASQMVQRMKDDLNDETKQLGLNAYDTNLR